MFMHTDDICCDSGRYLHRAGTVLMKTAKIVITADGGDYKFTTKCDKDSNECVSSA